MEGLFHTHNWQPMDQTALELRCGLTCLVLVLTLFYFILLTNQIEIFRLSNSSQEEITDWKYPPT